MGLGDSTWLFACPQGHTFPTWETTVQKLSADGVHSVDNTLRQEDLVIHGVLGLIICSNKCWMIVGHFSFTVQGLIV